MSKRSCNSWLLQLQAMCFVKVWTYCLFTVQRCFILYWFVFESIFVMRENRVESVAASQIYSTFLNYSVCFELKILLKSCFWCVLDTVLITWACQKLNFYIDLVLALCDVLAWKNLRAFCMHPRGFSLWSVDMCQFNWWHQFDSRLHPRMIKRTYGNDFIAQKNIQKPSKIEIVC